MLFGIYIYVPVILCRGSCPGFALTDRGELPKIEQFGPILEKRTMECTSNETSHYPPRPKNVLLKEYLGAAKPSMTLT